MWNAGQAPAGVSIDNMGKPWATSITSCEAVRINPTTNAIDTDSNGNQVRTYLGPSAYPYNYGDMTGICGCAQRPALSAVSGDPTTVAG